MRRYALVFIFCAFALLCTIQLTSADALLKVNLAQTRAEVSEDKIKLTLAIDNASGHSLQSMIALEILDPQNRVLASTEKAELIKPALHTANFDLSLENIVGKTNREIFWYRLRYRIAANNNTTSGILALSEITPDFFELRVATPFATFKGNRYTMRVVAARPLNSQPVSDVKINGEVTFTAGEDEKTLQVSGITNSEGFALLNFALPDSISERNLELKITGEYKGLVQEIEDDIQTYSGNQFLINSDKLIYQPGQILHVRALLLDALRHALADQDMTLKIFDEDQSVVYRAALKTSRFGIASADWQIPSNIRLGKYGIRIFTSEDDANFYGYANYQVRISRYELPNFTVKTKLDRSYYLPGQTPEVEVRGDYLFGQPLTRGHVKIVRETERSWNFREQKWDIQEEDKQEGELGKDGRFLVKLDLRKAQNELEDDDYRRFQDVTFTAYLTDPTTNRTEQRRFDVRLSREPIHVYFIRGRLQSRDFPSEFYLSTYYADGTPAQCQVRINQIIEAKDKSPDRHNLLRTVKTNAYGVARVENLFIRSLNDEDDKVPVNFIATDDKGRQGSYTSNYEIRFVDLPMVRLKTAKPIYRAGEPLELQIAASREISTLFVEVQRRSDWQPIFSKILHLANRRAQLTIPYQRDFKGELRVLAFTNLGRKVSEYEYPCDSRSVLYQNDEELKIAMTASEAEYRPGKEASVALRVNAQGAGVESALGVTVFDKAVDERTRTDNESRSHHSPYDSYLESSSMSEQISGINRRTLNQVDLSKPLAKDLQLVAEILFSDANYPWRNLMGTSYTEDYEEVFKPAVEKQFAPLLAALDMRYRKAGSYPSNGAELRRELAEYNLDYDAWRDPWGTPYRDHFYLEQSAQRLDFICAGVDRKFGSDDDFVVAALAWKYFKPVGEALDRALNNHHQRTGGYIGDLATLKAEVAGEGVDLSTLRDPWGKPYRIEFGILRTHYTVAFLSGGPNRRFEPGKPSAGFKVHVRGDDFTVWTSRIDYTTEMRAKLEAAFNKFNQKNGRLPQNDDEFAAALNADGIDKTLLKDGWGKPLYAAYKTESVYGDRMRVYSFNTYSKRAIPTNEITPVTRQIGSIALRSSGEDGKAKTPDDFEVAGFSRIIAEQAAGETKPEVLPQRTVLPGGTGSIIGYVTDSNGAIISNVKVTATNKATGAGYQTTTNNEGRYLLTPIASGIYEIKFAASGFPTTVITDVPVADSQTTELNVDLKVGAVTETVTVSAAAIQVQTQANFSAETIQALPLNGRKYSELVKLKPGISVDGGQARSQEIATPRLREYFPETLYWQPEVITDAQGRAEVKFKLADNITTWKFSALASTTDGRIGVVEKEIRAFQPFFAELDPPRFLTEGDEIALPVVLRNYLDKAQNINLELKPESWFAITGTAKKATTVKAGDAERAVFDIRALSSIKDGKQRVTAIATEASDAIEKPVTVHPDGEEISQSVTQIFANTAKFEIDIPEGAIKNSTAGELKIYPNLVAHLFESIEAIMRRPFGCAEQTISAAYPSLLAFRHLTPEDHSPVGERARRYLQSGYEKLLAYHMADGGFSYWGHGASDMALSAYALKFLSDARSFIAVDEEIIKAAQMSLIKKQRSNGSWEVTDWQGKPDSQQTLLLTAYVARALGESAKGVLQAEARKATERALNFLARPVDEFDEPYLIASYALAAMYADDKAKTTRAVERLQTLARNEADGSYWMLETNTPFYGWGLAGRVETTALAVKALAQQSLIVAKHKAATSPSANEKLIDRGLNFLLRNKDRYGVWYSTQATVNVLEALMTILSAREAQTLTQTAPDRAEIIVNGKPVDVLDFPASGLMINPLTLDLSKYLTTGKNLVEIRRAHSVQASAQTVVNFYQPWSATNQQTKSQALRLAVNFDKPQARIGEEITCKVEAERVGFRGYGMMLAEIGLPPGADVDRASLERAMNESGWEMSQYDVLPDRVIVYLWPRAGGTKFQFKFRPRFGINAQSASSVLYDYYNPEAQTIVAPAKFVVR